MYATVHVNYGPILGTSNTGHVWITVYGSEPGNEGMPIYSRGFNPDYDGGKGAQRGGNTGFATDDEDNGPSNWSGPNIPITQQQFDQFRNFSDRTNGSATWEPFGGNGTTGFNCATWARAAFNEMGIPLGVPGGGSTANWWPNNFQDMYQPRTEPGQGFDALVRRFNKIFT